MEMHYIFFMDFGNDILGNDNHGIFKYFFFKKEMNMQTKPNIFQ